MHDPAAVFVEGLIGYYGEYRGDGTKEAVVEWIRQRNLSQRRLRPLYRWCQENVSTFPPDIAQLKQGLRALSSMPPEYAPNRADVKLLEDGLEDRKAEVSELLTGLVKKLSERRKREENKKTREAALQDRRCS